jgi:predicted transposase/invertase (TIGR01784 family)
MLETLANVTQDEIEYARMSNLIKSQLDYQSGMVGARREGLAEGRNEASLDIAQKMKNAGKPLSEIMEFTGIPLETIEQM